MNTLQRLFSAKATPAVVNINQPSKRTVSIQKVVKENEILRSRIEKLREYAEIKNESLKRAERTLECRPPVWISDTDRDRCAGCDADFSFTNRRHHCRSCGDVFDAKCTGKAKTLVFYPNGGPQRVCDDCFEDVKNVDDATAAMLGLGGLADKPMGMSEQSMLFSPLPEVAVFSTSPSPVKTPSKWRNGGGKLNMDLHHHHHDGDKKKPRSRIPTPPPMPLVLPGNRISQPNRLFADITNRNMGAPGALKKLRTAEPSKSALDMKEIINGRSRLRETPKKLPKSAIAQGGNSHDDMMSELKKSLTRRRVAVAGADMTLDEIIDMSCENNASAMNMSWR